MTLVDPRYLLRVALFAAAIWLAAFLLYTSVGLMIPASGPVPVALGWVLFVALIVVGLLVDRGHR